MLVADLVRRPSSDVRARRRRQLAALLASAYAAACSPAADRDRPSPADAAEIRAQIETAVRAFRAADTARDAEAVIGLLWPEYTMLVDGTRLGYEEAAAGAREFMGRVTLFHTEWYDLQVTPLAENAAVASFEFRDSIITTGGELIRNHGTTTFVWQRRRGEWRVLFADAKHDPIASDSVP